MRESINQQATPSVRSASMGSGLDWSVATILIGRNSNTALHIHTKKQELSYFKDLSPVFLLHPSAGLLEHTTIEELADFLRIPSHNCCSTKKAKQILNKIEEDAVKERDYQ